MSDGPRVWHVNDSLRPPDAVYIGRAFRQFVDGNPVTYPDTPWKNPRLSLDDFRIYAVQRLEREPDWLAPLLGKHICCWCKGYTSRRTGKCREGKPCHGDVLSDLLNRKERS